MTRTIILICALCMATLSAKAQKTIEILHTNDTHSCVLPLNKNLADTLVAGRGGYLRRMAMVAQERQADPQLLLFDSGDFSQGSPFYTMYKGEIEVELMNRMAYDAATIGNHEFDFGLDNMAQLFRQARFPIVCCNYDFSGTPVEGLVEPYVVIRRKGLKIGVFGVCPQLDGLVDETKCQGVDFLDPVEQTRRVVKTLRDKEKCDLVVCLSHLGWEGDPDAGDQLLISHTSGIDLVLGGHSHTYFKQLQYVDDAEGKPVPDDQNGKHAIYVGKMLLTLSKK